MLPIIVISLILLVIGFAAGFQVGDCHNAEEVEDANEERETRRVTEAAQQIGIKL